MLFTTGLFSLGLEMVWVRDFTLVLGTTIYAFAAITTIYFLATAIGLGLYYRIGLPGKTPTVFRSRSRSS